MIETVLREGETTGWLPTRQDIGIGGTGTLCQHGIIPTLYYGAKYLPFVANGINWVEKNDLDVISWPFSGCIMAVFTYEGITRVCHVSTGDGISCLDEWNRIKQRSTNVIEFKPANYIDVRGGNWVKNYGIITRNNDLYSITVVAGTPDTTTIGQVPSVYKIASIQRANPI